MAFPVTGTAVAVGVYWGASVPANCPTVPQIPQNKISGLFNGSITNWSSVFTGCNVSVQRVVRSDSSGTTQNFKNYLAAVDPNTTPGCLNNNLPWGGASGLATNANNTNWPNGGSCSPLKTGHISGNLGVLDDCTGQDGGFTTLPGTICYADLADFENTAYQPPAVPNFETAQLQAGTGGLFVAPKSGHRANCDFSTVPTPASSNNGAVGLDPTDNWALDQSPSNANVALKGTGWPACAMTWDLVYAGTSTPSGTVAGNPNQQLTDNMRRTLYSYILYILGAGQTIPTTNYYSALPQGLLNSEINGFKTNY
jgi:hypothetical protein